MVFEHLLHTHTQHVHCPDQYILYFEITLYNVYSFLLYLRRLRRRHRHHHRQVALVSFPPTNYLVRISFCVLSISINAYLDVLPPCICCTFTERNEKKRRCKMENDRKAIGSALIR